MSLVVNGVKAYNTAELSKILGITVTVKLIKSLGIEPYATSSLATYWSSDCVVKIVYKLNAKLSLVASTLERS